LADQDHHGYPAYPEATEWSGVTDRLATEAWSDLDWGE
jgi:hypothetical protein